MKLSEILRTFNETVDEERAKKVLSIVARFNKKHPSPYWEANRLQGHPSQQSKAPLEVSLGAFATKNPGIEEPKGLELDEVLDYLDNLLETYGVEPLNHERAWDSYFGNAIALYLNRGETYTGTLLYSVEEDKILLTSWGDYLEQWEENLASEAEEN